MRIVTDESGVDWNEDKSGTRPGPEAAHYKAARKECGAHLLFNSFWLVSNFCVHQMHMKDSMHQIDLGATKLWFGSSWLF
jgi:hypothetical protein